MIQSKSMRAVIVATVSLVYWLAAAAVWVAVGVFFAIGDCMRLDVSCRRHKGETLMVWMIGEPLAMAVLYAGGLFLILRRWSRTAE